LQSSSSEYANCPEECEDYSPDEQRKELTPPSEDEQGEGSSSMWVDESASGVEVAAAQSSEQTHMYPVQFEGQAPPW